LQGGEQPDVFHGWIPTSIDRGRAWRALARHRVAHLCRLGDLLRLILEDRDGPHGSGAVRRAGAGGSRII
jgi:hypothetical protein